MAKNLAQAKLTVTGGTSSKSLGNRFARPIDVTDYGAVGDGNADDTAAINRAIAAFNSAGRAILYFPGGNYLCSSALTAITADGIIAGDGTGVAYETGVYGTQIACSSPTTTLFTISSSSLKVEDLRVNCVALTTAATGSCGFSIFNTPTNPKVDFDSVSVDNFYINFDIVAGLLWKMENVQSTNAVEYCLRIQNTNNHDTGDWSIDSSQFDTNIATTALIKILSSGGGKISNTKFNGFTVGNRAVNQIDVVAPSPTTVILLISNSSFENYSGNAINLSGSWPQIVLHGLQFGQYNNTSGNLINIANNTNIIISNISAIGSGSGTAIALSSVTNCLVSNIAVSGFTTTISGGGEFDVVAPAVAIKNSANFTANSTGIMALGTSGPAGNDGTVKKWLTVQDVTGTPLYLPCF